MKAAHLKRNINAQVELGVLTSFWTLTIRTSSCTPFESFRIVAESWNRLNTRLSKRWGSLEYVWTREATQRGYAHLHLLTDREMSIRALSKEWKSATGHSWRVHVDPVDSKRAGDYLAKYVVSQAMDRPVGPDGKASRLHVYGKSKGVMFEPFMAPGEGSRSRVLGMSWRELRAEIPSSAIRAEKVAGRPWVLADPDELLAVMPDVVAPRVSVAPDPFSVGK